MRILSVLLALAVLAGLVSAQAPPAPTVPESIVRQWDGVLGKVVAAARDFPEDKFDYRLHPDVRTFLEEIWHVTATVEWLAATMRGDEAAAKAVKFSGAGRPRDRAGLVAALDAAVKECSTLLAARPDARATSVLTHAAEDYGKLVAMYRVNGLVPPATRAAAAKKAAGSGDQRRE